MAPGQANGSEPPSKRQRTSGADARFDELEAVQHAQRTGDALSKPALSAALDTLLTSLRTSEATRKRLEAVLKTVKASLDSLPKKKTMKVDSPVTRNTLRRAARGSQVESLFRADGFENLSLACQPPVRVNVVGSFLLGYSSSPVADVAVEMPSELFQSKDYLNYRYHDKRMLYLVYLARHFVKTEEGNWSDVCLTREYLNNDEAKPVLCLSHVEQPDVTVRLIPTYADGVFEKARLAEDRRNVRSAGSSSVVSDPSEATVGYNASVLMDSTLVDNLQALHAVVATAPAFGDTVLLLNAWCVRHRLLKTKFLLAAVLANIVTEGIAPQRASREHLLRCALNSIRGGVLKRLQMGGVRLCAMQDLAVLDRCELSAAAALRVIESKAAAEDPWFGILPYLFATARGAKSAPRPLSTLFDGFIRVTTKAEVALPSRRELLSVLHRTLVDTCRVRRVEALDNRLFGLILTSHDDITRKVDTRPGTCDAASFKKFWGEKAGLRRFKDGRITESLVWAGGLGTLNEMCTYTFQEHFEGCVEARVIVGDIEKAAGKVETESSASRAIAAFDELATLLRSLEGLPLSIRAVHSTSAHLRRCGAYPIRPTQPNRYTHPLDIVASFETSGAWPDDSVAISAAKAAFYVALKSTLAAKGLHSKATISFLEIALAGFVFRLRIKVDKEKTFLPEKSEDVDALVWETETRVSHQDKIKHIGNALIGRVSTIAKLWLNNHLLLSQMGGRAEELVEVLVAAVMSRPDLYEHKSAMGYFCQFLHLLAEFPWEVCPLAVALEDPDKVGAPIQDDESQADFARFVECAQQRFSEKADGQLPFEIYNAWNAAHDDAETWFPKQHCPERVVVNRIVTTARSTLAFIEAHLTTPDRAPALRTIFATPTDSYDVILDLDTELTPFGGGTAKGPFRRRGSPLAGLDPVQMLRNALQRRLGTFAMFLAEQAGRAQIFVVWRPAAHSAVKFSLRDAPFRQPTSDGKMLEPCRDEMIAEMRKIGHGFVVGVRFPKAESVEA